MTIGLKIYKKDKNHNNNVFMVIKLGTSRVFLVTYW
jgi:hypothetical protein